LEVTQTEQESPGKNWRFYVLSGISILLTLLLVAVAIFFRDEIQNAQAYGYVGVFLVGILCGVSIIPAPTLLLVFTMGAVLNPLYVGLVAGLGASVGGITVYLTGAGAVTIWSRLRTKGHILGREPGRRYNVAEPVQSRFWLKGQALYNRLVRWIGGKGGYWVLFVTSAMIISPFYFAGLAAGSLRMGLLQFFLISWAGKTVRYLTVAFAGYGGFYLLLEWIGG